MIPRTSSVIVFGVVSNPRGLLKSDPHALQLCKDAPTVKPDTAQKYFEMWRGETRNAPTVGEGALSSLNAASDHSPEADSVELRAI